MSGFDGEVSAGWSEGGAVVAEPGPMSGARGVHPPLGADEPRSRPTDPRRGLVGPGAGVAAGIGEVERWATGDNAGVGSR